MGVYSSPFDSQAAILPADPNSIPVTPAETKETDEAAKPEEQVPQKSFFGWRSAKPRPQAGDPEKASEMRRPTKVIAPIYNGLGVALALCAYPPLLYLVLPLTVLKVFMGSGLRMLLMEWFLDGDYVRFSLAVTMPFLFCVSLVSESSNCTVHY